MIPSGIELRELSPALVDDYLRFFDEVAFKDFPWWSACYCRFFNDPSDTEGNSGPEFRDHHRALASELVRSRQTQGILAYAGGTPIGWCNAAPRASFLAPRHIAKATDDPREPVGATVCFIVAEDYRNRGVGAAMLDAACDKFRRQGLRIAEGYPKTEPAPTTPWRVPSAQHEYHGPLSMYLNAGFEVTKRLERFAVVRKKL